MPSLRVAGEPCFLTSSMPALSLPHLQEGSLSPVLSLPSRTVIRGSMVPMTLEASLVVPDDDRLHPRDDDPYWNESSWISVMVPERGIGGSIYFYHRPNMKLTAGGPFLFDLTGQEVYDCLYWDFDTTQAMPADADMFDFALDNSLTVRTIELGRKYRVGLRAVRVQDRPGLGSDHGLAVDRTPGRSRADQPCRRGLGRRYGQPGHRGADCRPLRDVRTPDRQHRDRGRDNSRRLLQHPGPLLGPAPGAGLPRRRSICGRWSPRGTCSSPPAVPIATLRLRGACCPSQPVGTCGTGS